MADSKKNALSMKAKLLMLVGIPVIVIVVCSFVIYFSAQSIVENEKYVSHEAAYELPASADDAAKLALDSLSRSAAGNTAKVHKGVSVGINDLAGDLSDAQAGILNYIKGSIQSGIEGLYGSTDIEYGEDTSLLSEIRIFSENAEYEFNEESQELRFTLEDPGKDAEDAYAADLERSAEIFEQFKDVFTVGTNEAKLSCLTFTAKADMAKSLVKEVNIARDYDVKLGITFTGDFKELGEQELTFRYTVRDNYSIAEAGIEVTNKEIRINKNGYDTVALNANVSENAAPEDFHLTYTIDDESIATVDEKGMVEAVAESETPATVTVTLEYLGNTYTDTCTVYVIKEVDSITMKPHMAEMAVGDTLALTVKFDPKDATIRNIRWMSEDESVAEVDENGLVTAKAAGQVKIIAVAEDGDLMTACSVTVKGNGGDTK